MGNFFEKNIQKIKRMALQLLYLICKGGNVSACHKIKGIEETEGCYINGEVKAFICPIYRNKKGILSIISDDGNYETGKVIDKLSKKYNIPVTIAGYVTNIGLHYFWWRKILEKNKRIEIINHSYNHICMKTGSDISFNKKKLVHEITHSKMVFDHFFEKKQISFVCPENQMCKNGYKILFDSGIYAVRRGERGLNSIFPQKGIRPGELFNLKCMGIMDCQGEEAEFEREKWIQSAIYRKKWLIEMWHDINDDITVGYQTIQIKDAEVHLSLIKKYQKNGDLWVAKFNDVIKYFIERDNCIINTQVFDKELVLSLDYAYDMDESTFDAPLTVCMELPTEIIKKIKSKVSIVNNCIYIDIKPKEEKRIAFI